MLIERVNARLGWRCVGRISLKQGPLERSHARRRAPPAPSPATVERARAMTEGIEDTALREALNRLGAQALSAKRAKS